MKEQNLPSFLLVFDEIQKINNWTAIVKRQWDQDTFNSTDVKLILIGSSRLFQQTDLTESLLGRFELLPMTHWPYQEMYEAFDISQNEYAWFGAYPGAIGLIHDEKRWMDYIAHSIVEPALSRDIFLLTRVDKPALLNNLLEFGCLNSGRILSYNKILGQIPDSGNTTTLTHYVRLLSEAGLLSGLEKFSNPASIRKNSSPKFIVNNTALSSALSRQTYESVYNDPVTWNRVIESAIGAHFINTAARDNVKVYYWNRGELEVNFVLERHGKIVAVELVHGNKPGGRGLNAFKKEFTPDKTYVVGSEGLSWREVLRINPGELF
jgi:predicted AAA+ superfamily ATPase